MNTPSIQKTLALIFAACLGSAASYGTPAASSDSPIVVLSQEGVTPVRQVAGNSNKASGKTYFLRSAVQKCSAAATPKPTPTAQPTPSPKPTPKAFAIAPPVTKQQSPATKKDKPATAQVTVVKSAKGSPKGSCKSTIAESDDLDEYSHVSLIPDPIEPVNRGFFWFNHQLYHYAFHPLTKAYKAVLPSPVRTGIYNAFDNLEYPVRFVNDLLQWQPKRAGLETEKFIVNSTAGVAGIFKVSDRISWLKDVPKTDTGVTLAKWGIPPGCYIVWPVLGPRSLRDTVGFAGDLAMYPVTWVTYGAVGGLTGASTLAVSGPDAARNTSDKMDTYNTLTRTSIDRYLSVRSAYEQNRKKAESR